MPSASRRRRHPVGGGALLRRVLEIREKALGANHGKVRRARRNFLNALRALKAPRDAKRIAAPDEQDH